MRLRSYLRLAILGCAFTLSASSTVDQKEKQQLLRFPNNSVVDNLERDYFLYLLDSVLLKFHADKDRVYLTGASMGGFGTWYYASKYPEKFAAILPVVGFPSVEQAEAVAKAGIPAWVFSGGRDPAVQTEYFFAGMNRMNELGAIMRFTTEQDMFHDVWNRVYAGEDAYNWLLKFKKR